MDLQLEVRREIVLPATRETVWELLTDADHLAGWFANEVELDLRPGGDGVFRWANGEERHARVTAVDAEHELQLEWAGADGIATTVTFALEDADEGTRVTVVESAPESTLQASAEPVLGEWAWAIELLARIRVPAFARG
jgi:uncharacterized protein YndB with AHSA1/START domain